MVITFEQLSGLIQKGRAAESRNAVGEMLRAGRRPRDILDEGLVRAMDVVGELFQRTEIYVPEVLIASRAMYAAMDVLRPSLVAAGVEPLGKIIIGTVKGDLHDIGKNLVKLLAEGAGLEVVDLGTDVDEEQFLAAYKQHRDARVIALSALLTTTMVNMQQILDAFREAGVRKDLRVVVGGAPVTPDYAKQIGADGYAPDASGACMLFKDMVKKRPASLHFPYPLLAHIQR